MTAFSPALLTRIRSRFAHVEAGRARQGKTPADATLDEMEALWQAAKRPD